VILGGAKQQEDTNPRRFLFESLTETIPKKSMALRYIQALEGRMRN
jgi:hypothetical protein